MDTNKATYSHEQVACVICKKYSKYMKYFCFYRLPSAFLRAWDRHHSQSFSAGHSRRIRVSRCCPGSSQTHHLCLVAYRLLPALLLAPLL